MPSSEADRVHNLDDFAGFLDGIVAAGCEAVVIGGCAVAAYGRLMGEALFSVDIDLYADRENLDDIVHWCRTTGAIVRKMPQVRNIPVAFIEWEGKEVNVLTSSLGLPPPSEVARTARVFHLRKHPGLSVLVADPFDLLTNKLRVDRPKDRPHAALLQRFIEEEVVTAFQEKQAPRERIAPARRLLKVLSRRTLPEHLAERLVPLARTEPDFRFLMNHVPREDQAVALLARAGALTDDLAAIRARRRFQR